MYRHDSEKTVDSTYAEDASLINGTEYPNYGADVEKMPRLDHLKYVAEAHRDSTDSVDVELSTKPPVTHSILYRATIMTILVCSGAAMTLCMKTQDQTCLSHCEEGHEDEAHYFHQPFIQLFHLGLGQLFCGVFTPLYKNTEPGLVPIKFKQFMPQAALASLFDVCAEVLIILGLSLTLASVTEMLKTTMVVFVGLLSLYFFPGFIINWKQWVASVVMLAGSLLVILQSFILGTTDGDTAAEVGGAFLVIGAQLFYGMEFVVEEKLMDHSKIKGLHVNKAQLVFALGVLSMTGAVILQIPWTLITSDFPTFGHELELYFQVPSLWAAGIGISCGVIGFDLAGLAISEVMGSDRRAISVAAFQVAIVWTISILVGWEEFLILSLVGFIMILGSGAVYVFTSKTKSEPHQMRVTKKKMKVPH